MTGIEIAQLHGDGARWVWPLTVPRNCPLPHGPALQLSTFRRGTTRSLLL